MAQSLAQPLSVAQAKQQLRGAAEQMGVEDCIKQYPFISLFLAFAGGVLFADKQIRDPLIRYGLSYLSARSELP